MRGEDREQLAAIFDGLRTLNGSLAELAELAETEEEADAIFSLTEAISDGMSDVTREIEAPSTGDTTTTEPGRGLATITRIMDGIVTSDNSVILAVASIHDALDTLKGQGVLS